MREEWRVMIEQCEKKGKERHYKRKQEKTSTSKFMLDWLQLDQFRQFEQGKAQIMLKHLIHSTHEPTTVFVCTVVCCSCSHAPFKIVGMLYDHLKLLFKTRILLQPLKFSQRGTWSDLEDTCQINSVPPSPIWTVKLKVSNFTSKINDDIIHIETWRCV